MERLEHGHSRSCIGGLGYMMRVCDVKKLFLSGD